MFLKKKRKKNFRIKEDSHFTIENYISYLEFMSNIYDGLVKEGLLPEEDKRFRKAIIKSFKKEEIIDLLCPPHKLEA